MMIPILLVLCGLVQPHAQVGLVGRALAQGTTSTQTGAVTDTNLYFSPYTWYSNGGGALQSNNVHASSTYVWTTNPGAYFKTIFGGTSVALASVDVSTESGASVTSTNYPTIEYCIDCTDASTWTRYQVQSTDTAITLATGLADTYHTLEVDLVGVFWNSNDRWNNSPPTMVFKFGGLTLDASRFIRSPVPRPNNIVIYGDSVTEGWEALGVGVTVANQNARLTYGALLGKRCLNAEYGIVGFAGQGYELSVPTANVPALSSAWDHYAASFSRLVSGSYSPAPTYIISDHGINGTTVAADVSGMIASFRAAAGSAKILMVVPWNGTAASTIQTGVTNAADGNAYFINTGKTTYLNAGDNHMLSAGHFQYFTDLCPLIP